MLTKILICILFFAWSSSAQNLKVIISNTVLPSGRTDIPIVYDGEDSIYLSGGQSVGGNTYEILKYSLSADTLQNIGTMPTVEYGSQVWIPNGTILHFGGYYSGYRTEIRSFDTSNPSNWTIVSNLPKGYSGTPTVWDGKENFYTVGGSQYEPLATIAKYSSVTNSAETVAQLPNGLHSASVTWDDTTDLLYIFGGRNISHYFLDQILKFDPTDGSVSKLDSVLPMRLAYGCAVWTGREAYIVGGASDPQHQLPFVRFTPSTNEITSIPVDGFPTGINAHSCVFVEDTNRIYMFGGFTNFTSYQRMDKIMYIDLDGTEETTTESPPTTTTPEPVAPVDCIGVEDFTIFPNPFCCESWYHCYNQQAFRHECGDGLQFSPSALRCESRELVGCYATYRKSS